MAGKNKNKGKKDPESKTAAQNRKARFEYHIEDTLEAGLVLTGTEVKSLRSGQASINESYASVKGGEIFMINAHIPEYAKAHAHLQHEPRRPRKLLLHKNEMNKLIGAVQRKGVTIVPLAIYFNPRGIAKVSLGIASGKKKQDKRESIKDRDWQREKSRLMREKG
jgi:SsrA-binding protein